MVAGDKRRSAENLEVKNLDYFYELCGKAYNTRDSCLMALLFLSGRRIGEIMHLKKSDLVFSNGFLSFKTFNLKSFRKAENREFKILRDQRYYPEITTDISRTAEAYGTLGCFVEEHLNQTKGDEYVFKRFNGKGHIGTNMAYKIITFASPDIWPHWFRHQRITNAYNIIKDKVKDPTEVILNLHDFTKHRRIDTTLGYIHRSESLEIKKLI